MGGWEGGREYLALKPAPAPLIKGGAMAPPTAGAALQKPCASFHLRMLGR